MGRGKGSGDAWDVSVRDQMGGGPDAKRLDLMSREEKRENQAYWKARLGYNRRWVAEGVFSIFKRMLGEHGTALKWENIVQEIRLKVALYNKWRDESIARELGEGRVADGVTDMQTSGRSSAGVQEELGNEFAKPKRIRSAVSSIM